MYAQLKVLVYHTTSLPITAVDKETQNLWLVTAPCSCRCGFHHPLLFIKQLRLHRTFSNTSRRASKAVRRQKGNNTLNQSWGRDRLLTLLALCIWAYASTAGVLFVRVCCGFSFHEFTLNSRCQQRVFNQAKPLLTFHQLHCMLSKALSKKIFTYTHTMYTFLLFMLSFFLLQ